MPHPPGPTKAMAGTAIPPPETPYVLIAELLPYQLGQASGLLANHFRKRYLAPLHLDVAAWRALALIGERGQATAAELVAQTATDHVTLHRAIKDLTAKKLVNRKVDQTDRRSKLLRLTTAGRARYVELAARARELDTMIRQWIEPAEQEILSGVLQRITREARRL